jgi:hypothetical protein
VACGNSSVEAWGNSSVEARENSSVEARENSSVEAWGNSSVEAWGNSSVVARGNSSVEARGNSSVVAWENSSVVAWGNVQVSNYQSSDERITTNGNARIVYLPKTIREFMDFYGTPYDIDSEKATFYKAVRKDSGCGDGVYRSDHDSSFFYEIGKTATETCDPDVAEECSHGIHIAHLEWILRYGEDWNNLAILEVETPINKIVLPNGSDGKVRTSEVTVIREVPLTECGIYGKILAKKRGLLT